MLHRYALRVGGVEEHRDGVEVFTRGDVAQRVGLAHHIGQAGVERLHVLDELVVQAAFEQGSAQGGGAHVHEQVAGLGGERHGVPTIDVFEIHDIPPFGLSLSKPFDKLRANGRDRTIKAQRL